MRAFFCRDTRRERREAPPHEACRYLSRFFRWFQDTKRCQLSPAADDAIRQSPPAGHCRPAYAVTRLPLIRFIFADVVNFPRRLLRRHETPRHCHARKYAAASPYATD